MQNVIVAAIVLYACWYVLKRYLSRTVVAHMANLLLPLCARLEWRSMEKRLAAATVIQKKSGGCDSCSACAKEPGNTGNLGNVGNVGNVRNTTQKIPIESLRRSLRR